ncbi:MAG TPA: serine hydrolase domain-containing protein, partial [Verrucomicrobiae bacterium]|nr:serine hydrolase domain-containing protein [Verrucomicrobiae bacterium]
LDDKFHIGSCTKSMTALLAVLLARDGTLSLETRPAAVFPTWDFTTEQRQITLDLLLQHRSGIGNEPEPGLWRRAFSSLPGSPREQRQEFLRGILAQPLAAKPGTKYIYSNLGYTLAGAVLEQSTGVSWEELIQNRIFEPLGLTTAGFGPPDKSKGANQPSGHQFIGGQLTPLPGLDNPAAIAPAGAVHMSILDLARYAAFHLAVFNEQVPELKSFRSRLYTPPEGSDYAYGWIAQKRSWADGAVLTHAGSNTMFFTVIWIAPAKDYCFIVTTNAGDREGSATAEKCDQVIAALIKEFLL